MKTTIKKALSGLAVLAIAASVGPFLATPTASAAPAGTAPEGSLTMTPPSGDSPQSFALDPDDPQVCPGDGATDGYRWQTFMVDVANDPATLVYESTGPATAGTTGFVHALLDTGGNPIVNQNPDIGNGNISGIPMMSFQVFPAGFVPAGDYYIGIACTLNNQTETFWQLPITITTNTTDGAANISYAPTAVVAVPAAPTLDSVTAGNGTIEAAFTAVESNPATDSYTVTATPTGGGDPVTATGTTSPITVGGLTNGTVYSVTVHATNAEGDSPESNAELGTPFDENAQPAVGSLTYTDVAPAGSGEISVDWDAPSSGETPTGYDVTVDPADGVVVSVNDADADTSATVTGLTPGTTYTITVTPLHEDPLYGTPASISATPLASGVTVLEQNVTVTRPAGAVVFTQICEDSAIGTPLAGATFGDASCAIAFGTAARVIPGSGAPYYEAEASLNNVQVDSNGEDTGWKVTGQMTDFTKAGPGGDSFSGDQLGWDPAQVSATPGLIVVDGGVIAPGTPGGLSNGETLASAAAGSSVGIAEIDADLTVKIPMQNKAGEYSGTLTMTATPGV